MAIFDIFTKKKGNGERRIQHTATDYMKVPKEAFPAAGTGGWDAIVSAFTKLYPGQRNPKFYKPPRRLINGGKDPFDGVLVYDGGDYWHFIGLGLSELYGKVTDNPEVSGWGVEYSFKLKKDDYEDEEAELKNVYDILQSRARDTMNSGEVYRPYQTVYTGGETGIDYAKKSGLTGFIAVEDEAVSVINTPNGELQVIAFVGVTSAELRAMSSPEKTMEIYGKLGSDITDYRRPAVV